MIEEIKKGIAALTALGICLSFAGCSLGTDVEVDPRLKYAHVGDLAPWPDAPKFEQFDGVWHKLIPTSSGYEYVECYEYEVPEQYKPGYEAKIQHEESLKKIEMKKEYENDKYTLHYSISNKDIFEIISKQFGESYNSSDLKKLLDMFKIEETFDEYNRVRQNGSLDEIKDVTKKLYINMFKVKSVLGNIEAIKTKFPKTDYVYDNLLDIIDDVKIYINDNTNSTFEYSVKVYFKPIKKLAPNNNIIDYKSEVIDFGRPSRVDSYEIKAFYYLLTNYKNITSVEKCDELVSTLIKHIPCNIDISEYDIIREIMELNEERLSKDVPQEEQTDKIAQLKELKSQATAAKVAIKTQNNKVLKNTSNISRNIPRRG